MKVTYTFSDDEDGDEDKRLKFENGETFYIALEKIQELRKNKLRKSLNDECLFDNEEFLLELEEILEEVHLEEF